MDVITTCIGNNIRSIRKGTVETIVRDFKLRLIKSIIFLLSKKTFDI